MLRFFSRCFMLCIIVSTFFVSPALGQWMFGAGGVFSSSPYKDYDRWTPIPIIAYNGKYAYIRGTQAGLRYSPNDVLTISAFLEYDFTNFEASGSSDMRLQYLDDRFGSLLAGIGAEIKMPFGGQIRSSVATNILNTHSGIVGNFVYERNFFINKFFITPFVGLKLYDSNYINYYYGVDAGEAAISGLDKYEVDSMALEPNVGIRIGYSFTQNISAMVGGSLRFMDSAILDSPMVDNNKTVTYTVFGGLSYRF